MARVCTYLNFPGNTEEAFTHYRDGFLPLDEVDDETWHRVMSINLDAVMRLSRAVLPEMLERGRGSIVKVTSEAGLRASAAGTAYTVSKHAVVGLTRSAAFF